MLALSVAPAQEDGALPIESISSGISPAIRSSTEFVVARTPEQWAAAWRLLATSSNGTVAQAIRPQPPVDLRRFMVTGIVLASHFNGCTGVTITGASVVQNQVIVSYHEPPKPASAVEVCTTSFATAYHFVAVPVSPLPVVFKVEGEASNTSIERTSLSWLSQPKAAAHVER